MISCTQIEPLDWEMTHWHSEPSHTFWFWRASRNVCGCTIVKMRDLLINHWMKPCDSIFVYISGIVNMYEHVESMTYDLAKRAMHREEDLTWLKYLRNHSINFIDECKRQSIWYKQIEFKSLIYEKFVYWQIEHFRMKFRAIFSMVYHAIWLRLYSNVNVR